MDGQKIYSSDFWRESWHPDFRLPLPERYVQRIERRVVGASGAAPRDMVDGATDLVKQSGQITLQLLETLRADVDWSDGDPLVILG